MADVLGLVVNVTTCVDLFIKVGVLCSVYCAGVRRASDDIRSILNETDRLTATLNNLQRGLTGATATSIANSKNIRDCVEECRKLLQDLVAKLETGAKYKKVLWPLRKEEVARIMKDLERCRATISLDLQVNQSKLLVDLNQDLVLKRLRIIDGVTYDSHVEAGNPRCHPGTRVSILQHIQTWGAKAGGECLFWLNGAAGTGKSTISRTVAQYFDDRGMLGASFFFKRGEGDRGRAAFLFTTVAAQLARILPAIAPHLQEALKTDPGISNKHMEEQFNKLIVAPIKKITNESKPPQIVIVVDALDECDSDSDVKLLISLISQAGHLTSDRLKFFVTSRPEQPIMLGFKEVGKYDHLVLHEVSEPIIEHDIASYLEHELPKIRRDYNRLVTPNRQLPPDWPGTETVKQLVDMAIPLFIFAATICRFIQDRRLGGPKDQLTRILGNSTNRKSNLAATYLPVLNRLLIGLGDSEKQEVAGRFKQVVGSIVTLAKPLSATSLARLLRVRLDIIEDQLDLLHSVLSIPPEPHIPIRLFHLSFRNFLTDHGKSIEQKHYFWVDEQETHERLATCCLELLASGVLKTDVCGLHLPGTLRSSIDSTIIDTSLPPEVQYACRYWVYHLMESKFTIRDGDLVDRFLASHLLHWLEALSLVGCASESPAMIENLLNLLHPADASRTATFLLDTQRLVSSNYFLICEYPLQVYCSAILFASEQSLVRKQFQAELLPWISLWPRVDLDRDTCLTTFESHTSLVTSLVWSHDTRLASTSWDTTVKIWDSTTGQCITTLEGHTNYITSMAWSHDTRLASTSWDTTVKIWDSTTGQCITTLEGHTSRVISVAWSHDTRLASASYDGTVKIWDSTTGQCITTLEGHAGDITSVAWSHDARLASASEDKTVKIWDSTNGQCLKTISSKETLFDLEFDETSFTHLHTRYGTIDLRSTSNFTGSTTNSLDHSEIVPIYKAACGFKIGIPWITYNGDNVIWLPAKYRPSCFSSRLANLAMGCESGQVIFFKFSGVNPML